MSVTDDALINGAKNSQTALAANTNNKIHINFFNSLPIVISSKFEYETKNKGHIKSLKWQIKNFCSLPLVLCFSQKLFKKYKHNVTHIKIKFIGLFFILAKTFCKMLSSVFTIWK